MRHQQLEIYAALEREIGHICSSRDVEAAFKGFVYSDPNLGVLSSITMHKQPARDFFLELTVFSAIMTLPCRLKTGDA